MIRLAKLILTVGMLVVSCDLLFAQERLPVESSPVDGKLANTQWRLISFGSPGAESPVVQGSSITVKFGPDGRVGGSGGCNSYGGKYLIQGDNLSISKVISTKRACLEESLNQQEQRYFAALESAARFELSNSSLTITSNDGRSVLNFVKDSSAAPTTRGNDDQCSPVTVLRSYYDAINARDYERAYRYWETPPSSLEDFAQGYAKTSTVQLILQPPKEISAAAGSLFADIPTMLIARQLDGGEQVFIGCYVTRKSNLDPADIPKQELWRIYKASMSPVSANTQAAKMLATACRN